MGFKPRSLKCDIKISCFSAEAAVGILAKCGVKDIFTAGIDGGTSYSASFDEATLLANGRATFDEQFTNIIGIVFKNNINYQSLKTDYPIKIYIAAQAEQMLAVKVLEYSIRKHTVKDVEIYPLHLSGISYSEPNDQSNRQRTPFSFQNLIAPE